MSLPTAKKAFKYILAWGVLTAFIIYLSRSIYYYNLFYYKPMIKAEDSVYVNEDNEIEFHLNSSLKYVLVWTNPRIDPIVYLGEGLDTVYDKNCSFTNCYIVAHRNYFDSLFEYDAIVFHGPNIKMDDLPKERSPTQKYVFASMESSENYPICSKTADNFFNWTWTYKLDSDEMYSYITIRDEDRNIIGPRTDMQWMKVEEMQPVDEEVKYRLSRKKQAAAWFVSHCDTLSKREYIAKELAAELAIYNHTLDIYGRCGTKECRRQNMKTCLAMLETDYYFYLSFENSLTEDYVTEKLLHALQHYTVPVVYGGANYTRFMPDGIYLDARKTPIPKLAFMMVSLMGDKEAYYNYFKWHNHYSYHHVADSSESNPYCKFCALINDEKRFQNISMYPNFTDWWNPKNKCK